jgi:hypothetical protein
MGNGRMTGDWFKQSTDIFVGRRLRQVNVYEQSIGRFGVLRLPLEGKRTEGLAALACPCPGLKGIQRVAQQWVLSIRGQNGGLARTPRHFIRYRPSDQPWVAGVCLNEAKALAEPSGIAGLLALDEHVRDIARLSDRKSSCE